MNNIAHRFIRFFFLNLTNFFSSLSYKYIFRDLKPENILLTSQGNIKLTDFGVSTDFSAASTESKRRGFVCDTQGTWAYWAPEICSDSDIKYSAFLTDIWAAGIVLYTLLFSILPFWNEDMDILFTLITARNNSENKLTFPSNNDHIIRSDDAKSIVEFILVGDPQKRPSISSCLSHNWILKYLEKDELPNLNDIQNHLNDINNLSNNDEINQNENSNDQINNANKNNHNLTRSSTRISTNNQEGGNLSLVIDTNNDNINLEEAITPGKPVYISKRLFRKLVSKISINDSNMINTSNVFDQEESNNNSNNENENENENENNKSKNDRSFSFAFSINEDDHTKENKDQKSQVDDEDKYDNDNEEDDEDDEGEYFRWSTFESPLNFRRRTKTFVNEFIFASPSFSSLESPSNDKSSTTSFEESFTHNSHEWKCTYLNRPTYCHYCTKFIWGITKSQQRSYQCQICHKICHYRCCYIDANICHNHSNDDSNDDNRIDNNNNNTSKSNLNDLHHHGDLSSSDSSPHSRNILQRVFDTSSITSAIIRKQSK